jgi:hypothetical protein
MVCRFTSGTNAQFYGLATGKIDIATSFDTTSIK